MRDKGDERERGGRRGGRRGRKAEAEGLEKGGGRGPQCPTPALLSASLKQGSDPRAKLSSLPQPEPGVQPTSGTGLGLGRAAGPQSKAVGTDLFV